MQGKEKFIKKLNFKSGTTLVELVVAFALLEILIVAGGRCLSFGLRLYYEVKSVTYSEQVADTLLKKISGELESSTITTVTGDNTSIIINQKNEETYQKNDKIELYDSTGSHIVIYLVNEKNNPKTGEDKSFVNNHAGEIAIHYYPVYTGHTGNSTEIVATYEAVEWTFDKSMYMNFEVTDLSFQPVKKDEVNVDGLIWVHLKIRNKKNGYSYETDKLVECYNKPKITEDQVDFN